MKVQPKATSLKLAWRRATPRCGKFPFEHLAGSEQASWQRLTCALPSTGEAPKSRVHFRSAHSHECNFAHTCQKRLIKRSIRQVCQACAGHHHCPHCPRTVLSRGHTALNWVTSIPKNSPFYRSLALSLAELALSLSLFPLALSLYLYLFLYLFVFLSLSLSLSRVYAQANN